MLAHATLAVVVLFGGWKDKIPVKIPGAASQPAGSSDAADRTQKLYEALNHTNSGTGTEANELFDKFGVPTGFNPKITMKNLDAEWIPGWDSLSLTDETRVAIAQAAVNKSWSAQCTLDFNEYRAAWKKIDGAYAAELAGFAKPGNYYTRAAGLSTLLAKVRKDAEGSKVLYPAGYEPANVGLLNDIVTVMVALHKETGREFALAGYLAKNNVNLADYAAHGRKFADDATERDIFCSAAVKVGTLKTPAVPVMAEYGKAFSAVKWPVSNDRTKQVYAQRDALVAKATTALAVKDVRAGDLLNGSSSSSDPKLWWVYSEGSSGMDSDTPFKVTSVKPLAGGGLSLAITQTRVRMLPYDCRDTNKVDRIDPNTGKVVYVKNCKMQKYTTSREIAAEMKEVPSGVDIKVGDALGFYADLASSKETIVTNTAPAKTVKEAMVMKIRHLENVQRGATKVLPQS